MPFNLAGNLRNFKAATPGNFPSMQTLMERNIKIGEVATILPPEGTDIINAQGHDIDSDGKQIEITPQLLTLFRSGFIRIVPLPPGQKLNPELAAGKPFSPDSTGSETKSGDANVPDSKSTVSVVVSSPDSGGDAIKTSLPPAFSSKEEVMASTDWEGLGSFIESKTGRKNFRKKTLEQLREEALPLVNHPLIEENPFAGI